MAALLQKDERRQKDKEQRQAERRQFAFRQQRRQEKQRGHEKVKLKNVLIVVRDIERSRRFYQEMFGLEMLEDHDGNMILTGGLALQEAKIWREFLRREIIPENNSCELYFEEPDLAAFVQRLEQRYPETKYVNRLMTHSWGQQVIRFYDPDGNLIEVGTPMG